MKRKEYKWKKFKMTWLVPNYARSRGPAWWLYKCYMKWEDFRYWWYYNIVDGANCCGLRHKFMDWLKGDVTRWLTPQLRNARKFIAFFREYNGTKLLDSEANCTIVRTRDENQYYFLAKSNLFGNVTIKRWQWLDSKGKAHNAFMWGLFGEDEDKPVKHEEIIFKTKVFTKKQLDEAKEAIVKAVPEVDWFFDEIKRDSMAEQLGWKDEWEFTKKLNESIFKEFFPGKNFIYELTEEEDKKYEQIIMNMSLEEAAERVK